MAGKRNKFSKDPSGGDNNQGWKLYKKYEHHIILIFVSLALRVSPVVTRLTVYRRFQVFAHVFDLKLFSW